MSKDARVILFALSGAANRPASKERSRRKRDIGERHAIVDQESRRARSQVVLEELEGTCEPLSLEVVLLFSPSRMGHESATRFRRYTINTDIPLYRILECTSQRLHRIWYWQVSGFPFPQSAPIGLRVRFPLRCAQEDRPRVRESSLFITQLVTPLKVGGGSDLP